MLALIAVKPDLISAMLIETLQGPKRKILFPAAGIKFSQHDTEQRQRSKRDPFMLLQDASTAGCWETCSRQTILPYHLSSITPL